MLDYCWLVVVSTAPIPRARVIPPLLPHLHHLCPPHPSSCVPLPPPCALYPAPSLPSALQWRGGLGGQLAGQHIVRRLSVVWLFFSRFILKILNKNLNVKVNFHWYIGKVVDLLWDWSPGCHNLLLGCPDTAVCPKVQMEANLRPNGKN